MELNVKSRIYGQEHWYYRRFEVLQYVIVTSYDSFIPCYCLDCSMVPLPAPSKSDTTVCAESFFA